jgi:hypothetical protein
LLREIQRGKQGSRSKEEHDVSFSVMNGLPGTMTCRFAS